LWIDTKNAAGKSAGGNLSNYFEDTQENERLGHGTPLSH